MRKLRLSLASIAILCLLAVLSVSCSWDDRDINSGNATPQPGDLQAYEITATYGADQFRVQLTAIAESHSAGSHPSSKANHFP